MPNCLYCLEEIKTGARKCPHCQTSLEPPAISDEATTYILDKGLIKFAKFAVSVLAIFVLVGIYLFGYDVKEAGKKTSEAEIQVQKALLEIERQRMALDAKIRTSEQRVARIETLESETAKYRDDTQRSAAEVKQLVLEMQQQKQEARQIIIELRTLGNTEATIAVAKREEKGIGADRGKLWKNGSTIKFRFLDGGEQEKAFVRLAIDEWSKHVNLVFKEVPSGDVEIRISFAHAGSWSFQGTDALGIPQDRSTLNYGTLRNTKDRGAAMQTALHEFGHTLGLVHEYQNPYAGEIFDRAATLAFFLKPPQNWNQETIERNVLTKAEYPGKRPYDPESVMNHRFPAELFIRGKHVRPGNGLSNSDKATSHHFILGISGASQLEQTTARESP
jgi:hypothetical protein